MTTMQPLDPLDARILLALDDDPSATTLAIAHTLGVARNTVAARLQRIERAGVLKSPSRRLDPGALGYDLVAFVELSISQEGTDEAVARLSQIPEIVEIHATTGDADLLTKLLARDTTDLYRITKQMLAIPGVIRTSTSVSMLEVLPLRMAKLLQAAAEPPGR
jgi:DNA-binding Lrp family transcriptional regulator